MAKKGKVEVALGKNKDVIVPFKIAWARQPDMSIHEQRVILRIMEFCSAQLNGIRVSDNLRKIESTPVTYEISMPVTDAFTTDFTVEETQKTLNRLRERTFQYEDDKRWWACGYIEHPEVIKGTGMMTFGIFKPFWNVLLNFVSGFREIELNKALLLPTTYSLRFYMLMSGKTQPIYMSVEDLKNWLGIAPDKYKDKNGKDRIDHLEERVIRPAQKALDETCPYSFTYEKVRLNPRNSKSSVVGFKFYSRYQPQYRDPELEKASLFAKVNASSLVGSEVYRYLKNNFGLTSEGLNNATNKALLEQWVELESSPMEWLEIKRRDVSTGKVKGTPQAYIIGTIKRRVEELNRKHHAPSLPFEDADSANTAKQTQRTDIDGIANAMAGKFGFK